MESNDRLNLQNDKDVEKLIPFEQGKSYTINIDNKLNCLIIEPILFSEQIQKVNRWNIKQDRVLILTVKSVCVFRKKCKNQI